MLGVELFELWRAGRVRLPALAEVYWGAARELRAVPHDDAEWVALRWRLVGVLAAAGGQVEEAGAAVCQAVARYAAADEGAAAELRRLRDSVPGRPG